MCPYSEYFWSVFFSIRTEYRDLLCKSPYLVRKLQNTDQKTPNSDTFYAVHFINKLLSFPQIVRIILEF